MAARSRSREDGQEEAATQARPAVSGEDWRGKGESGGDEHTREGEDISAAAATAAAPTRPTLSATAIFEVPAEKLSGHALGACVLERAQPGQVRAARLPKEVPQDLRLLC